MLCLNKQEIDRLLLQLEEKSFIDSRYKLVKDAKKLKLLGFGTFSYVYEMYDVIDPQKHYAAKVIGLGTKSINETLVLDTSQIQYHLSEQSENVMRIITLWMMKLHLDEKGNIFSVIGTNQIGYEESDGTPVQIVLMEKLDNILFKDKYGHIELLREELKSEDGVIKFAEDIGKALFTVHSNGFLHRDIKLENIFWDPELKKYKLGDFGIARYVGNEDAETMVFTDGYGAPEIERQLAESYNLTADIYSFGITLFLLLNNLNFPASNGYYANVAQYTQDFIIPAPINASEKMSAIIRKMCSYNAADRYQSVEEVLMDIGRIDGSYSDQGFTEYEDLETETYREQKTADTQKRALKENDFFSWRNKYYQKLTKEDRKRIVQAKETSYSFASLLRIALAAILTFALLKAFVPNATYISRWELWLLPVAVFIESLLQRLKEFHVDFGLFTIGLAIFSMCSLGADLPQISAIVVIILGIPALTAGFSIGMVLWIAQVLSGKPAWLEILSKWDLGWIVMVLFAAMIEDYVILRVDYEKSNKNEHLIIWVLDNIWYLMIIAGLILWILGHFNVIIIPNIVKHIHLVRTGLGIIFMEILYLMKHNVITDREDNTHD